MNGYLVTTLIVGRYNHVFEKIENETLPNYEKPSNNNIYWDILVSDCNIRK